MGSNGKHKNHEHPETITTRESNRWKAKKREKNTRTHTYTENKLLGQIN